MKVIKLLLAGAFALGINGAAFAAEQKSEASLVDIPEDMKKHLLSFIIAEPDFAKVIKKAGGLAEVDEEYKRLIIEELVKRFKNKEEAEAEFYKLSKEGTLNPLALAVLKLKGVTKEMQELALNMAAENRHAKVVDMLIEALAPSMKNKSGYDRLIWAIRNRYPKVANILRGVVTDLNRKNRSGNTALMIAADEGNGYMVDQLIELGADLNIKNLLGETALDIAKSRGHKDIVKELQKAKSKLRKFIFGK